MTNWVVYNFECADVSARETLMKWFEENHPVVFPSDEESTFSEIETESGLRDADYAWIDRYLYVTVFGEAESLVRETMDLWERAVTAAFDGETETATEVTVILDTDAGADDEVAAIQFSGLEGYGGSDAMYTLAMKYEFRFRSYSVQSPIEQVTPHPGAFDFVSKVDSYVEHLQRATKIEPTASGIEFIRTDPAATPPSNETEIDAEPQAAVDGGVSGEDEVESVDVTDEVDSIPVTDVDTAETTVDPLPDEAHNYDDKPGLLKKIRRLFGG